MLQRENHDVCSKDETHTEENILFNQKLFNQKLFNQKHNGRHRLPNEYHLLTGGHLIRANASYVLGQNITEHNAIAVRSLENQCL